MRRTVVASKQFDINATLDSSQVDTLGGILDKSRDDDVQKRTFKYLSDFFWTNVQKERRQEIVAAK